jgi:hypothetical protein
MILTGPRSQAICRGDMSLASSSPGTSAGTQAAHITRPGVTATPLASALVLWNDSEASERISGPAIRGGLVDAHRVHRATESQHQGLPYSRLGPSPGEGDLKTNMNEE